MNQRCTKVLLMALFAAFISAPAFAQASATSSIQGVVQDTGGGVIPGATVTATNEATAGKSTVVSSANGSFTIPALNVGSYTVEVELQGFKKAVLKGVAVTAGAPASLLVKLEIGGLTEQVVVEGASSIIQTQSSAAANTITTRQIGSLPLGSRNTLDFVTFLPGVNTPGGNRDSTVNGLPQSSINITVDGVSVQDNYLKSSDGFFARMSPRLDAIEEVTVTTAGNGAEASSQGAIQIRFTTRSGSNVFNGSAYMYYQTEKLNTNTYFNEVRNLPKNVALQYQPGIRAGGPVVLPGIYDGRGKLFFFANYEENRTPRTSTRNSTFLTDEARAGIFRYGTGGANTVNLYNLATATGNTNTPDPLIAALLNDINTAATSGNGTITALEGNYVGRRFSFQQPTPGLTRYPTVRMDYNISANHRFNSSLNINKLNSTPDTTNGREPFWPGFPVTGGQLSDRYTYQASVRSTLSANMVNEARYGMSGGATRFSPQLDISMWNGPLANQGGYAIALGGPGGISDAGSGGGYSAREASTKFVDNTLNWLRGSHSIQMGGTYTQADVWLVTETRAPGLTIGVPTGDPALASMFTSANFPGSSTAERNTARDLYAVLTGRLSAVPGTGRINADGKYVYNGPSRQEARLREWDFFIQDSWKVKPNLSLNAGLRYAYQLPIYSQFGSYSTATLDDIWGYSGNKPGCNPSAPTKETCNLFAPGPVNGKVPTYVNLGAGVEPYNADANNLAPSIGVNWTPSAESGFLRSLLGQQGDTSISGGWARSYERRDMSSFVGFLDDNPGLTTGANRNVNNGNLGPLPLLIRNGNYGPPPTCAAGVVSPSCMAPEPIYPIPTTITGSVSIFDPNIQVEYADSWTTGISRAIGSKSAVEVRYIGTRFRDGWTVYDMNEVNIHENNFLNEFKLAQANLYANIAAGRGNTFAYMGANTNTSPLPIFLAHFSGQPMANAGNAALYTSSNFTNQNYYNQLSLYNPNVFGLAGSGANGLNGTTGFRANALAAGLPRNFWVANPDVLGGARVNGNGGYTKYNAMQVTFRRRLSAGLQFDVNYNTGAAYESSRYSFRVDRKLTRQTGTPGDVSQALKGTFVYDLPFGAGKRFGSGASPVMDRIIGGWQVSGTTRIQAGRLVDLGNIRVNGMSEDEVADLFKFRRVGPDEMYMWPQDIIDNTIKAYSRDLQGYTQGAPTGRYFSPANGPDCIETISNGYGDCGVRTLVVTGPFYKNFDMSIVKDVRIQGRQSVQFRIDMLNLLDNVNFTPVSGIGSTTLAGYQITGATSGRVVQLVARFNW
jgi:hypothetical protein